MLSRLAERGDPIGSDRLLERLDQHLTGESTPDVVALDTRRRAMTTLTTTERQAPWWKGPKVGLGLAAATAVVVIAVVAIAGLINSDEPDTAGSPTQTVAAYLAAYNAGDIDGVMSLFTDESVISNLPAPGRAGLGANPAVAGLEAIRDFHMTDRAKAAGADAYVFSNVDAVGSAVTWDHLWTSNEGLRGCGEGHEAIVEDGKIVSWTFATVSFC
jgi:hypothetical protein